jgi:hypothetical protein
MAALCLVSSIGFFWAGDWRRGAYFALCVGINIVMAI